MRIRACLVCVLISICFVQNASAMQLTRDIKVISSAGARALRVSEMPRDRSTMPRWPRRKAIDARAR